MYENLPKDFKFHVPKETICKYTVEVHFISGTKLKQTWMQSEVIDWGTNNEPKKS